MSTVLCVYNMLGGCRSKCPMLCVISLKQNVADEGELRFLLGWLVHFQAASLEAFCWFFFYLQSSVSRRWDQRNLGLEKA